MSLRRDGICAACDLALPAGTRAVWHRESKTVRCLECPVAEGGTAGASARREYERRKDRREERIRAKHPKLGGLILALSDDPQSTRSWEKGAVGEERLGAALDERASDRLKVLHDRRIPGTKANIDHVVITSTGVWVVDPKRYAGRPELKVEGGILRPRTEKLVVAGRDRTSLVRGAQKQLVLVEAAVGPEVPVRAVLCFVESDWPLLGGEFAVDGVPVVSPRKLYPKLEADGPLDESDIDRLHRSLATAFPPA